MMSETDDVDKYENLLKEEVDYLLAFDVMQSLFVQFKIKSVPADMSECQVNHRQLDDVINIKPNYYEYNT